MRRKPICELEPGADYEFSLRGQTIRARIVQVDVGRDVISGLQGRVDIRMSGYVVDQDDQDEIQPRHELRAAVRRIRDGGWIWTHSGLPFWPLDPRPEDVRIEDIAYALARISRFNGHTRGDLYSVAQHSVHVSEEVEHEYMDRYGLNPPLPSEISCRIETLMALLHDTSEAYLCDVCRPVKQHDTFAAYRTAEMRLQQCIYGAFGLLADWELEILHQADRRMLRTEQRDLMPAALPEEGRDDVPPYDWTVEPWPWREAERRFLARFTEVTKP